MMMSSAPAPLSAKTPPTRAHTRGPTVPADEKNVYGMCSRYHNITLIHRY